MQTQVNLSQFKCPFCDNNLRSRYSKCFNLYCQGQEFNQDNLVIYRHNRDLGIGRIIKKLEIPASKSLEEEDSYIIEKFKVEFKNNITKILHPIDLIHHIFQENEQIRTKKGIATINTNNFNIRNGRLSYEVLYPDGKKDQVYESEILEKYTPNLEDFISKEEFDPPKQFLIKYWANLFKSYYSSFQIKCITNSRLTLMPHQINVAHRLSEEFFPRMILADEVGLGKTIEAGIYVKEMMARKLAERILIIVPATLVRQWRFEMENKFNIQFKIYDGKKIKKLQKRGDYKNPRLLHNPFFYDNLIICSLQFARNPKYIELLSQISWDIVVFDEAHHLRRYLQNKQTGNYRETLNYTLARNLSQNTESLLLLTATPLQLHSFELYSLIELIHPEAFESFSDFEHFRKDMPFINLLIKNINNLHKLNTFEVDNTIKLLKNLDYIPKNQSNQDFLNKIRDKAYRYKLMDKIEEDHTLSNFLIRNRKKNVFSDEYINERIVKTVLVEPTKEELGIYKEIRLYLAKIYNLSMSENNAGLGFVITTLQKLLTSSKYAILRSIKRRLSQIKKLKNISLEPELIKEEDPEFYEAEIEDENIDSNDLNDHSSAMKEKPVKEENELLNIQNQEKILSEFYEKLKAVPYDSKSDKLLELLDEISANNPNDKVLIFTQFVDTLNFLKESIKKRRPEFFVDTFYGGKNKKQKAETVENFRESNGFSILLSTEVGGEGRNFQFCRILINYDLPWNPMKLEQRIGRLDRIGQKSKEIYIYNFFLEGTIETDIIFALNKRINLFEESIGSLEPILGKIDKEFKDLIFIDETKKQQKIREFNRDLDDQVKKAKEIEMQLDDLLIDRKSFQMEGLVSACEDVKLTHDELYILMNQFFNLENKKYGNFEKLENENDNNKNKDHSNKTDLEVKITLGQDLHEQSKEQLSKEYRGTFDLDLARRKEEIDFFALGHPLIDKVLDFCSSDAFHGTFTKLTLKRANLSPQLRTKLPKDVNELYIFIFEIKFQGFIIESQISCVILDDDGNIYKNLADYILKISNFDIFDLNYDSSSPIRLEENRIHKSIEKARNLIKERTSQWKMEVQRLNKKLYTQEKEKKEKIYKHKRNALNLKIKNLKRKLNKKISQRPSERQKQNIANLKDEKKKQKRIEHYERLEETIHFLEKDISNSIKKLDDLEFEYQDLKEDMKKRNQAKFFTKLIGYASILVLKEN
ncbi:MAG: putative Helicase domain-containing protein [Promethearchaeota archaeon]|nr:MAG: putative Helicase domain-containing protein [Candidatus Lokiarchaeota archaeon]